MEVSTRPWFATGVALVGAGAIVMAPIAPIASSSSAADVRAAAAAVSRDFQLTALDLPYILTLPIVRQQLRNWAENWAVYLTGLADAGVGLAQSLLAIPGVTVEIVQEVLALNFVGAFDTFASAARNAVVAVGQPLLDSLVWRNQKALAVQTALQAALPQAFIDVTNGFLVAGNGVVTSLIQGTQDFIAAILTLNLSTIVNAAVDGTQNFIVALGDGAGAIVNGIEAAQLGITTALATDPPPAAAADVVGLRTLTADRTLSLAGTSRAVTLDAVGPTEEEATSFATGITAPVDAVSPPKEAAGDEADVVGTAAEADASPSSGSSHDATGSAGLPTKPVRATAVKAVPKDVAGTVAKVTARSEKDAHEQNDAASEKSAQAKNDAGTATKPASGADDK